MAHECWVQLISVLLYVDDDAGALKTLVLMYHSHCLKPTSVLCCLSVAVSFTRLPARVEIPRRRSLEICRQKISDAPLKPLYKKKVLQARGTHHCSESAHTPVAAASIQHQPSSRSRSYSARLTARPLELTAFLDR